MNDRYNILVEFAHIHLDFQRAELEAVLSMSDIYIGRDCFEISLPNPNREYHSPFMILSFDYAYANSKFNLDDEGQVLSDDIGRFGKKVTGKPTIAEVFSRVTLVRSVIHLFGYDSDLDSCANAVKKWSESSSGKNQLIPYRKQSVSWKITVHTLGTTFTTVEQNEMRGKFSFLDFPGPIKMMNPTYEYLLVREVELDHKGSAVYPRYGEKKVIIPENDSRPPLACYYGRVLGGLRNWRGKGRLEQLTLKKRSYLGPTSMDAELSLIMTNMARVKQGSFAFDPFVGTGSILLTCGLRGAYCFGTDIDIRVLRGKGGHENIWSNFKQYNLPRPDLVRSDNAIYHRHYKSHNALYDAIVTDPPYGIRAGARKSGSKLENPKPILDKFRYDHIAQTQVYEVSDVMADLLDVSAQTLALGGRLVYIIPSMQDFDPETDLPVHECLKTVCVSYQPLQSELGRRLVTMEKIKEYDPLKRAEYLSKTWVNGPESAEKCARIRERLIEAAKLRPDYDEKLRHRKQKRKETKEAAKKAKTETKTDV
jgi:tRNA (guanine10-N2)-methyltransferase